MSVSVSFFNFNTTNVKHAWAGHNKVVGKIKELKKSHEHFLFNLFSESSGTQSNGSNQPLHAWELVRIFGNDFSIRFSHFNCVLRLDCNWNIHVYGSNYCNGSKKVMPCHFFNIKVLFCS